MGCIDSVAFWVSFLLLFVPQEIVQKLVLRAYRKRGHAGQGSSYFPLVPLQSWEHVILANRKVFHLYKHFPLIFFRIVVTFPISILHCTNYNILILSSILNPHPSVLQGKKKKRKKICTLKVISEDLRQYSNRSAGTAAEWDLPNREKRGCF